MSKLSTFNIAYANVKKSYSSLSVKFGKTQPDSMSLLIQDGDLYFHGSIPGISVYVLVPDTLSSEKKIPNSVITLSHENMKTFSSVRGDAVVTVDDAFIEVKCGRTITRLPQESAATIQGLPVPESKITDAFANFLGYTLPILKKTTSVLARSETHLECCTDDCERFAIMSFVGSKIHLIETTSPSDELSVFEDSDEGTKLVIPFDLLEGLSDMEASPMIELDGNSIVLKTDTVTTITQTRDHSLGVGYAEVAKKVKTSDEGSIQFKFKASSLYETLLSLPSIPGNSEYDLKLILHSDKLVVDYSAKGVAFNGYVKCIVSAATPEPLVFSLELKELISVMSALSDLDNSVVASVMKSRVTFRVKSALAYQHFVGMSRVS